MRGYPWSFTIAGVVLCAGLRAQQAVVPAGGDATGQGGSLAWTLGQVDPIFIGTPAGTVAQGVQQPVEFLILSAPGSNAPVPVTATPNPANEGISLHVDAPPGDAQHYELRDAYGALLARGRITGRNTFIPLAHLPSATYVIRVLSGSGASAALRVVKQ